MQKKKKLTNREENFCWQYVRLGNGREAAVQAGYPAVLASRTAARLLQNPAVAECIRGLSRQRETGQKVKTALERILSGSANDVVKLVCNRDMAPEEIDLLDLYAVSEIREGRSGGLEVKFYDRLAAAQALSELVRREEPEGAAQFYSALERGAEAIRKRGADDDV